MSEINIEGTSIIVAVSIGIGELLKRIGVPSKFIPISNLIAAVAASLIWSSGDMQADLATGLIIGFSTSGVYSSGKNVFQGIMGLTKKEDDANE